MLKVEACWNFNGFSSKDKCTIIEEEKIYEGSESQGEQWTKAGRINDGKPHEINFEVRYDCKLILFTIISKKYAIYK